MERGTGPYIEDVDGNRYIDFLAGWGPLILGHRPKSVNDAVIRTLEDRGAQLGFSHRLEIEAAELAVDSVPAWEVVRFSNTGSEAVMSALRIARGYTSRKLILRFEGHFHGWPDLINFSSKPELAAAGPELNPTPTPGSGGMVKDLANSMIVRQWNDAAILRQTFADFGSELAAVICEPITGNCSVIPPEPGYLELLRELSTAHGVVLIFDEVKTGFRVALGGAQELYGVTPDLSVAAKALGAGFPISAIGGLRDLFDPVANATVSQSSTYQASPLSLAACIATINELRRPGFFGEISTLGDRLARGLTDQARAAGITGYASGVGPLLQFVFADHKVVNWRDLVRSADSESYRHFWRHMVDRGIMFNPNLSECWFVSGAHSITEIDATIGAAAESFVQISAQSREVKEA